MEKRVKNESEILGLKKIPVDLNPMAMYNIFDFVMLFQASNPSFSFHFRIRRTDCLI